MPTTLLWFSHDLRLHDNAALHLAAKADQPLICLYCIDEQWLQTTRYGTQSLGNTRWHFLQESLQDLNRQLENFGQRLLVTVGDPVTLIGKIIDSHDVDTVVRSLIPGVYEKQQWLALQHHHPAIAFHNTYTFSLFEPEQLSSISPFPKTFSSFRRPVEKLDIPPLLEPPSSLPPPLRVDIESSDLPHTKDIESRLFYGGETSGLKHLNDYFGGNQALTYKQTRNALDDWGSSCKFSPWLANGSLSARTIVSTLREFEQQHGANDSTGWIYFELLWREYFQWYAHHYGQQLFTFTGIHQKKPLTSFYPQRFKQWCAGETPWPIVNACMKQLNQTGYMSNRGRQLVASCLIHELDLDWRCGAAYFEQQLIDYDVGSNYGNWQYIAGVGADPRGGRRFNLEKQTKTHDPEQAFIKLWTSSSETHSIDHVDAADWPIE